MDQGARARVGHTCNVVGNFLYVLWGYDANRNFTNSVFIFDTGRSFRNLSSKFPFLFDTACLTPVSLLSIFNYDIVVYLANFYYALLSYQICGIVMVSH